MRILILFLLIILLSGCSVFCKPTVEYKYTEVKVPVVVDMPPLPEFPPLLIPYKQITKSSSDKEKAEALVQSIKIYEKELETRDKVIDELRPLVPEQTTTGEEND